MHSAEKHNKKGLKEMQANNIKAISARSGATKALVQPKQVKPRSACGSSHKLRRLAYMAHPKPGNHDRASISKGLSLCQPKAKAKVQTEPQAADMAAAQAPKGAQAPAKAPQWRPLSANVRMEGQV